MSIERNNLRKESETKNSIHLRRHKLILKGPLENHGEIQAPSPMLQTFLPLSLLVLSRWRPGHHYIRLNFQASLDPERELPLKKRQSQPTVLLRTHFTQTIKFHLSSLYSSFQFLYIFFKCTRILAVSCIGTLSFVLTQKGCILRCAPIATAKTLTWAAKTKIDNKNVQIKLKQQKDYLQR